MGKAEKEKPKPWKERKKAIKHKWLRPLIFPEWLCEWLSYLLSRWAFIEVLEYGGKLAIILAVISYAIGGQQRQIQAENQRKAKHYQAWQVISAAQGKPGSGGRIDALQDLNKDEVSLASIDLSKANLQRVNLCRADLRWADLSRADLTRANLSDADLRWANLSEAEFFGANLRGARLSEANLSRTGLCGADFSHADLSDANCSGVILDWADLSGANLCGANFSAADLSGADLSDANFSDANLCDADLSKAVLHGANLSGAKRCRDIMNIEYANIHGVKNPPKGFIEWAKERGAVSIESKTEWEKLKREKMREKNSSKQEDN